MSTNNKLKCPRCKSTDVSAKKLGFTTTQAIGGSLLLGPLGLLHGLTGKDKVLLTCNDCNHKWYPHRPDYSQWPDYE